MNIHRGDRLSQAVPIVNSKHIKIEQVGLYALTLVLVIFNALDIFRENIKYLGDANVILRISNGELSNFGDKSYGNVAFIYKVLGLHFNVKFGETCILLFFLFAVIKSLNFKLGAFYKVGNPFLFWTVIYLSIILSSVYFRVFTKELIPLFINILIGYAVARFTSKRKVVSMIAFLCLLYAYYFRDYWYVVTLIFITIYIAEVLNKRSSLVWRITYLSFILFTLTLLNSDLFTLHNKLNEKRFGSEFANSAFTNIPDGFNGFITWPLKVIALFLPFPFIQKLNIQIIIAWLTLTLLFLYVIKLSRFDISGNWQIKILLLYLTSFILTLGIFEPDYGSFTKHMSPFIPIIFQIITLSTIRGKPVSADSKIKSWS